MRRILIVTEAKESFQGALEDACSKGRCSATWANSLPAAVSAVKQRRPDLAIIDSRVGGQDGPSLCRRLLRKDAFVNMALVSDLSEDDFHEATEGLGLLGRLPANPTPSDLHFLLERLDEISLSGSV